MESKETKKKVDDKDLEQVCGGQFDIKTYIYNFYKYKNM